MQFIAAYKSLLINTQIEECKKGNCLPLDGMRILSIGTSPSVDKNMTISSLLIKSINCNLDRRSFLDTDDTIELTMGEEIENIDAIFSYNDVYYRGVIPYIAGFVVRKIEKSLKCLECFNALESDCFSVSDKYIKFIQMKDKGGLTYPSTDVIDICTSCEQQFKANFNGNPNSINIKRLITLVSYSFIGVPVLGCLKEHDFENTQLQHSTTLFQIVAASYLELRLSAATRQFVSKINLKIKTSRQSSNKLILFKGL